MGPDGGGLLGRPQGAVQRKHGNARKPPRQLLAETPDLASAGQEAEHVAAARVPALCDGRPCFLSGRVGNLDGMVAASTAITGAPPR